MLEQFRALYPKTLKIASAYESEWLKRYSQNFPRSDWEPLERFRAFPLFLRGEKREGALRSDWLVDLALFEWTEFVALYNPIDEVKEARSLKGDEVMINPTSQILRLDFDIPSWNEQGEPEPEKVMAILYRIHGRELKKLVADWSIAAIADVLLENGRISEPQLLKEILAHQGSGYEEAWREKIQLLKKSGLILSRS